VPQRICGTTLEEVEVDLVFNDIIDYSQEVMKGGCRGGVI